MLALLAGAVSLSQEIVWVRILSFTTASLPETFGFTLGSFLIGIAVGSLVGKRVCASGVDGAAASGLMLTVSALVFFLAVPFAGWCSVRGLSVVPYILVGLTAAASGGVFPIVCEMARGAGAAGKAVSWVYLANIVGATGGSLLTGFVLLDVLPVEGVTTVIAIAGAVAAAYCFAVGKAAPATRLGGVGAAVGVGLLASVAGGALFGNFLENLQYGKEYPRDQPFKTEIQNRHGIITIDEATRPGDADVVYGGGVYDGRYAVYPGAPNGLFRCYMVAALHPEPKKVLEIGLSSGSWAAALLQHEALETLDSVEINPGYIEAMKPYPDNAVVLSDPRVTIHIDDGRRWLGMQDEGVDFDFILMNTTLHWRSHAANLLSKDFLELCHSRLAPGGVVFYNATGSDDVLRTAAEVFEHVTLVGNFVAASDTPFTIDGEARREQLLRFKGADGEPVFLAKPEYREELETLVAMELPELGPKMRASKEHRIITDDNMACEFPRQEGRFFGKESSWGALFRRMGE